MGKNDKKAHSTFQRDQMNGSLFEIVRSNIRVWSTGGGGEFFENPPQKKILMGKNEKKAHSKIHSDQMNGTHSLGHFRSAVTLFQRQISKFCIE